jgi:hypothetical protein
MRNNPDHLQSFESEKYLVEFNKEKVRLWCVRNGMKFISGRRGQFGQLEIKVRGKRGQFGQLEIKVQERKEIKCVLVLESEIEGV